MPARTSFACSFPRLSASLCGLSIAAATQACGRGESGAGREGSGAGETSKPLAVANGTEGLLTLMYHDILDCSRGKPAGMVDADVCLADLEAQMDALRARGYRTTDLSEVYNARASGRAMPSKTLLVTFDDNDYGTTSRGLPALARRGMKATIFAHTGMEEPPVSKREAEALHERARKQGASEIA